MYMINATVASILGEILVLVYMNIIGTTHATIAQVFTVYVISIDIIESVLAPSRIDISLNQEKLIHLLLESRS